MRFLHSLFVTVSLLVPIWFVASVVEWMDVREFARMFGTPGLMLQVEIGCLLIAHVFTSDAERKTKWSVYFSTLVGLVCIRFALAFLFIGEAVFLLIPELIVFAFFSVLLFIYLFMQEKSKYIFTTLCLLSGVGLLFNIT